MPSPIEIIQQIKETQGTLNKEQILKDNEDNKDLKALLVLAYNPYMNFGFTKLAPNKSEATEERLEEFAALAVKLMNSNINDSIREEVNTFLSGVSESAQQIYCAILNKKLSIGIAEKSINKVIPDLIPTFECMLASSKAHYELPCIVEEKLDGVRCIMIKKGKNITAYTRAGREIPLKKLKEIFAQLPSLDVVLDGELLLAGEDRKNTSGKINKLMKTGYDKEIDDNIEYYIFDAMTFDQWRNKQSYFSAFERANEVRSLVALLKAPFKSPKYRLAELEEHIAYFYKEIRKAGGEGVIIKPDKPYEWKRSKHWVKLKAISSCTLKIVGYEEGTGKNIGQVGSVKCISEDGQVEVSVNPKTDEIRAYITENRQRLIHSKIEVLFNELIQNKNRSYSLFLPRMADNWLRVDKGLADTLAEISQQAQ